MTYGRTRRYQTLYNNGISLLRRGEYNAAIDAFKIAGGEWDNSYIYSGIGRAYYGMGKYHNALHNFEKAYSMYSYNTQAAHWKAKTLGKLKRYDEAEKEFENVLRLVSHEDANFQYEVQNDYAEMKKERNGNNNPISNNIENNSRNPLSNSSTIIKTRNDDMSEQTLHSNNDINQRKNDIDCNFLLVPKKTNIPHIYTKRDNATNTVSTPHSYTKGLKAHNNGDYVKALELFIKSAEKEKYAPAMVALGYYYAKGLGTTISPVEAFGWFKKAGDKNCLEAELNLVYCYETGFGTARDMNHLYYRRKLAADLGDWESQVWLGNRYEMGDYEEKNYQKAAEMYRLSALSGDTESQYRLGLLYRTGGYHLEKNILESKKWLEDAAKSGHKDAQFELGNLCSDNTNSVYDPAKSRNWYLKAAQQGHPDAQFLLARLYDKPNNTEDEARLARKWYEEALNNGHPNTEFPLAEYYELGKGGPMLLEKAIEYYKKEAKKGNKVALRKLGNIHDNKSSGYYDLASAKDYYEQAANLNDAEAQYMLGSYYERGLECASPDKRLAFNLYKSAADAEYPLAQYHVGMCYKYGVGTDENIMLAVDWFKKAAINGIGDAQYEYARCLEFGITVPKDPTEAYFWYNNAAINGQYLSQKRVAKCYEDGFGCEINKNKALKWYEQVAENGDVESQFKSGILFKDKSIYDKAYYWFKTAASNDHVKAQFYTGQCYELGEGTEINPYEAFNWYKKAAESGDQEAEYSLGHCYEIGFGVDQSKSDADFWYRKSNESTQSTFEKPITEINSGITHPDDQYNKGVKYLLNGDIDSAIYWLEKSSFQGFTKAQYKLGCCYLGISNKQNMKDKDAIYWFEKAASKDHTGSIIKLGICYGLGIGTKKNDELALKYYEEAIKTGNCPIAFNALGEHYLHKKDSITKNLNKEAVKLFKDALSMGDSFYANVNLGECIYKGYGGIGKSNDEAIKCFETAIDSYECTKTKYNWDNNRYLWKAERYLGKCLYGNPNASDMEKSKGIEWLTKAADSGDAKSKYLLGEYCLKQHEKNLNETQIIEWLNELSEQGDKSAKFLIFSSILESKSSDKTKKEVATNWMIENLADPKRNDVRNFIFENPSLVPGVTINSTNSQQSSPDLYIKYCRKGDVLRQNGKHKDSIECYLEAKDIVETHYPYLCMGMAYQNWYRDSNDSDKLHKSLECLDKALSLSTTLTAKNKSKIRAIHWKAKTVAMMGRYDESAKLFNDAYELLKINQLQSRDPKGIDKWIDEVKGDCIGFIGKEEICTGKYAKFAIFREIQSSEQVTINNNTFVENGGHYEHNDNKFEFKDSIAYKSNFGNIRGLTTQQTPESHPLNSLDSLSNSSKNNGPIAENSGNCEHNENKVEFIDSIAYKSNIGVIPELDTKQHTSEESSTSSSESKSDDTEKIDKDLKVQGFKFCRFCGCKLSLEDIFCKKCGKKQ